jgi:hypothetical protein
MEVCTLKKESAMESVWKSLPYDIVRLVIKEAGLNYNCTEYIRFERRRLKNIPYIEFPTFNLLQKNTEGRRFVLISNPILFSMRVFDVTHDRFLDPDRSVTYSRNTGKIIRTEVYYDVEEQEFTNYVWDEE